MKISRPSLVQLNRPLKDFPDEDSVEDIQDSRSVTAEVEVAYDSLPVTVEVVIAPRFSHRPVEIVTIPGSFITFLKLHIQFLQPVRAHLYKEFEDQLLQQDG